MSRASKWVKALFQPKNPADIPIEIVLASGQTADAIVVKTSAGAEVFSVAADGTVTPAGGTDLADTFTVHDPVGTTKKARLDAGNVTAGQTRVMTVPDYDGTIATVGGTETLTAKTLTSPKVGTAICDTGGNEIIKTPATADAVNEFTATNAAADTSPQLSVTGGDTHISLRLAAKGAQGFVVAESGLVSKRTASSNNTAANLAYTAAQVLGGMYLRDCNGAHRADTLPTAADLVAGLRGAAVGTSFLFVLRNTSDDVETITVTAPDGSVTISGTATVAQNNTKLWLIVLTNVGAGTEAYTAYSLGTFVH